MVERYAVLRIQICGNRRPDFDFDLKSEVENIVILPPIRTLPDEHASLGSSEALRELRANYAALSAERDEISAERDVLAAERERLVRGWRAR